MHSKFLYKTKIHQAQLEIHKMAELGRLMELVFLMDLQIDSATFLVHHSTSIIRPAPNSVPVTIPAFCPPTESTWILLSDVRRSLWSRRRLRGGKICEEKNRAVSIGLPWELKTGKLTWVQVMRMIGYIYKCRKLKIVQEEVFAWKFQNEK